MTQSLPICLNTCVRTGRTGTAWPVSGWMARRGATVVGIDNSLKQLETTQGLAIEHASEITWIHGDAERVPCPNSSFDSAISEYGAAIWCDPVAWIPEAHRILRPGGHLVFLGTHPLAIVCTPLNGAKSDAHLHRSYFDLGRIDWRKQVKINSPSVRSGQRSGTRSKFGNSKGRQSNGPRSSDSRDLASVVSSAWY